jgi:hypothetical protein
MKSRSAKTAGVILLVLALGGLVFAGSAGAELTGELKRFETCPYTTPLVSRCVSSVTTGGEVVLGNRKVPITNPVTLQGGYTEPIVSESYARFFPSTDGVTLSRAAQPIPGGLTGVVAPTESSPLVKTAMAFFFENDLTGVDATLELARPANEIRLSENHLAEALGVALKLPVRVHLENPFLGSSCYVGSSNAPIWWELSSGASKPPGQAKPMIGSAGKVEFLEKGTVLGLEGAILVDGTWSAPAAKGCGGFLSFLVDPMVNAASGLPSPVGKNSAQLEGTIHTTTSVALEKAKGESP